MLNLLSYAFRPVYLLDARKPIASHIAATSQATFWPDSLVLLVYSCPPSVMLWETLIKSRTGRFRIMGTMKTSKIAIVAFGLGLLSVIAAPVTVFLGVLLPKYGAQIPEQMATYLPVTAPVTIMALCAIILGILAFIKGIAGRVLIVIGIVCAILALVAITWFNPLFVDFLDSL
jgi:hypothetical protein